MIALFRGFQVPMMLRARDTSYQIVGTGYFYDVMGG